ncbi:MAG: hypothetical protein ACM3ZB_16245 [bacterium]
MKRLLILLAVFAIAAAAADINGTWKANAETPMGPMVITFVFKADGAGFTGEMSDDFIGKAPIVDGKLDGNNVSFTVNMKFEENEMQLNYKGTVNGDEMKLSVETPGGNMEMVAKRQP